MTQSTMQAPMSLSTAVTFQALLPPKGGSDARIEQFVISRRLRNQYEISKNGKVAGMMSLIEDKHAKFLNARRPVKAIIRWVLTTHAGSGESADHVEVTRLS